MVPLSFRSRVRCGQNRTVQGLGTDSSGVEDAGDEELLALVAGGDSSAFDELYARHAGWLLLRLTRRCSDPGLAEEVLQDTFVSVWRSAAGFSGDSAGGWLWTVASRRLVDSLRRAARTPQVGAAHGAEPVGPGPEDELSDLAHGDLGAALAALSPELRQVLQATVLDGLSTREAAVVLGIAQGTVKTRASRARAQLRAGLA